MRQATTKLQTNELKFNLHCQQSEINLKDILYVKQTISTNPSI